MNSMLECEKRNTKKNKKRNNKRFPYKRFGRKRCLEVKEKENK